MSTPSPHQAQAMAAIFRELSRQGMAPSDAIRAATGRAAVQTSGLQLLAQGHAVSLDQETVNHVERLFDFNVWKRKKEGRPTGLRPREV